MGGGAILSCSVERQAHWEASQPPQQMTVQGGTESSTISGRIGNDSRPANGGQSYSNSTMTSL